MGDAIYAIFGIIVNNPVGAFMCFLAGLLMLALFALHIYGIILGFRKKWYWGVLALFFGIFAFILAIPKLFFNKDILA